MSLQEQQYLFALDVAKLIQYISSHGLWVTLDEAYRTTEQAKINADKGIGIVDSLHCKRLAIDLNIYKDGKYLYDSRDYIPFGKYWESLNRQNRSGCWFTDKNGNWKPDGRHFERRLL